MSDETPTPPLRLRPRGSGDGVVPGAPSGPATSVPPPALVKPAAEVIPRFRLKPRLIAEPEQSGEPAARVTPGSAVPPLPPLASTAAVPADPADPAVPRLRLKPLATDTDPPAAVNAVPPPLAPSRPPPVPSASVNLTLPPHIPPGALIGALPPVVVKTPPLLPSAVPPPPLFQSPPEPLAAPAFPPPPPTAPDYLSRPPAPRRKILPVIGGIAGLVLLLGAGGWAVKTYVLGDREAPAEDVVRRPAGVPSPGKQPATSPADTNGEASRQPAGGRYPPLPPVPEPPRGAPRIEPQAEARSHSAESAALRAWIETARVSGVALGPSPRAIINGKLVRPGDVIDAAEGVIFDGIDTERKEVIFRTSANVFASKPY